MAKKSPKKSKKKPAKKKSPAHKGHAVQTISLQPIE